MFSFSIISPPFTNKSLHHFLAGSDTMLHHCTGCKYCLPRLSMSPLFRHVSSSQILTCGMCKIHLLTCYHLHTFINFDLFGGLSVCNLFSFGDAQAPTMQGRLYNGVPCLEPFACTTCRRYKQHFYMMPITCHNNGIKADFHALQTIII